MPETDRDEERLDGEMTAPQGMQPRSEQAVEDEEKVLAGRLDANMPALLTKDVLGG